MPRQGIWFLSQSMWGIARLLSTRVITSEICFRKLTSRWIRSGGQVRKVWKSR